MLKPAELMMCWRLSVPLVPCLVHHLTAALVIGSRCEP
jgi:hypothetical protein